MWDVAAPPSSRGRRPGPPLPPPAAQLPRTLLPSPPSPPLTSAPTAPPSHARPVRRRCSRPLRLSLRLLPAPARQRACRSAPAPLLLQTPAPATAPGAAAPMMIYGVPSAELSVRIWGQEFVVYGLWFMAWDLGFKTWE
jgi:hypothetical protein